MGKRFIYVLALFFVAEAVLFAQQDTVSSPAAEAPAQTPLMFSTALRISVLGLEPVFGIKTSQIEADVSVPMHTSIDNTQFGWGIQAAVGYLSTMQENNIWQNGFGVSLMYLPAVFYYSYGGLSFSNNMGTDAFVSGAASLYYKGILYINKHVCLNYRYILPLFVFMANTNRFEQISVLSMEGIGSCISISGLTQSVGFSVYF